MRAIRWPATRGNKYHAKRVRLDGYLFASKAEARRYQELQLLARARKIHNLEVHPRFPLVVGACSELVGEYEADFAYIVTETLERVVEDVKADPTRTPLYKLKRNLMRAVHGIDIREVHG